MPCFGYHRSHFIIDFSGKAYPCFINNPWEEDTSILRPLVLDPKGVLIRGAPLYSYLLTRSIASLHKTADLEPCCDAHSYTAEAHFAINYQWRRRSWYSFDVGNSLGMGYPMFPISLWSPIVVLANCYFCIATTLLKIQRHWIIWSGVGARILLPWKLRQESWLPWSLTKLAILCPTLWHMTL